MGQDQGPLGGHPLGHGDPLLGRSIRTVSAARHGVGVITVVTPLAISSQVRVMEPTWAKGSGDRRRSPGSDSTSVPAATAARLAWSKTAPLGSPVVPLVHTTATGSSGARSGNTGGGGPGGRVAHRRPVEHRRRPGPAGSGAPSSTTVTAGRVRSRIDRTSGRPRRRLMPEVIAPSRVAAA